MGNNNLPNLNCMVKEPHVPSQGKTTFIPWLKYQILSPQKNFIASYQLEKTEADNGSADKSFDVFRNVMGFLSNWSCKVSCLLFSAKEAIMQAC